MLGAFGPLFINETDWNARGVGGLEAPGGGGESLLRGHGMSIAIDRLKTDRRGRELQGGNRERSPDRWLASVHPH